MSNFTLRDVGVSPRTVSNLLARYDELVALNLSEPERIKAIVCQQQRVVLAIDMSMMRVVRMEGYDDYRHKTHEP